MGSGLHRRVAIIALFGVNIASGYFAMLVAMTYSVELFICMIVGLVIGHGIFNTGAVVGESVDPCCASQRDAPASESLLKRDTTDQCLVMMTTVTVAVRKVPSMVQCQVEMQNMNTVMVMLIKCVSKYL